MKRFIRLIRRLLKRTKSRELDVKQLNNHTLRDLGIDRMAAEHQRDARLWQQLAS